VTGFKKTFWLWNSNCR